MAGDREAEERRAAPCCQSWHWALGAQFLHTSKKARVISSTRLFSRRYSGARPLRAGRRGVQQQALFKSTGQQSCTGQCAGGQRRCKTGRRLALGGHPCPTFSHPGMTSPA